MFLSFAHAIVVIFYYILCSISCRINLLVYVEMHHLNSKILKQPPDTKVWAVIIWWAPKGFISKVESILLHEQRITSKNVVSSNKTFYCCMNKSLKRKRRERVNLCTENLKLTLSFKQQETSLGQSFNN